MIYLILINIFTTFILIFLFDFYFEKKEAQRVLLSKYKLFQIEKKENKVLKNPTWIKKRQLEKQMVNWKNETDDLMQKGFKNLSKKWKKLKK